MCKKLLLIQKSGILIYKKVLMSENRKNYILRDINHFVKCLLVRYQILCTLQHKN